MFTARLSRNDGRVNVAYSGVFQLYRSPLGQFHIEVGKKQSQKRLLIVIALKDDIIICFR